MIKRCFFGNFVPAKREGILIPESFHLNLYKKVNQFPSGKIVKKFYFKELQENVRFFTEICLFLVILTFLFCLF